MPQLREKVGKLLLGILLVGFVALLIGIWGPGPTEIGYWTKGRATAKQIIFIGLALEEFREDVGRYPSTGEGLKLLITNSGSVPNWQGPYLKRTVIPRDPWGHNYVYLSPGNHQRYYLYSLGADGKVGGQGDNADITSW